MESVGMLSSEYPLIPGPEGVQVQVKRVPGRLPLSPRRVFKLLHWFWTNGELVSVVVG